jgi:hypothetical protein
MVPPETDVHLSGASQELPPLEPGQQGWPAFPQGEQTVLLRQKVPLPVQKRAEQQG